MTHLIYEDRKDLTPHTLDIMRAIDSIKEELEAVDLYKQRADATKDEQLKEILLHNAREEYEHAAMLIEWLRRNEIDFDHQLKDNLFKEGKIAGEHGDE